MGLLGAVLESIKSWMKWSRRRGAVKQAGKMIVMSATLVILTLFLLSQEPTQNEQNVRLVYRVPYVSVIQEQASAHNPGSKTQQNPAQILPTTTTQPPQTTTDVWQHPVYAKRRQWTENMCSTIRTGAVNRLARYGHVSYCVVPKVGCTFWVNVFRFLHKDTGGRNFSSPFDIPRMITHYASKKIMKYYMAKVKSPQHLLNDVRFMFVRDPYSRLWSAYVDKMLLVDYWHNEGQLIVHRRPHQANTTTCATDISFKEFIEYVTSQSPEELNEHWRPIQYLCSPCMFHPHVIGKMETFSQDSRYVLQMMNASWVLDSYDHQKHVYQEMEMLVSYNFQIMRKYYPKKNCTNGTNLSRRLWKTFQINGYIPTEMDFPDPGPREMKPPRFLALAQDAYRNRPNKDPATWRHQREQIMVDAYRAIPMKTLKKLQALYKEDFELYGYDPQPASIYGPIGKPKKRE